MANISNVVVAVMIMLCFAIHEADSASAGGCSNTSGGCFDHGNTPASQLLRYFHHRKVLLDMNGVKEKASGGGDGATTNMGDWELRRVPSGPDPLHHNGDGPKKPRTTP